MFSESTFKPRPKHPSIFHANIRDKKAAVSRLRSAYHKTSAEILLDGSASAFAATLVLAEISSQGVYLFTPVKLRKKAALTFTIHAPLAISVRGYVRFSEVLASESSIQALKPERRYRTYIEFSPNSDAERLALEDLYFKVRDESYVATRWHHYRNEIAQREIRARIQAERMKEQVKSMQDEPVLATEDLLVSALRMPAAG